ncbi:MAG: regulatory protein RecX [Oscillospiraceae bacterium]|nr:regulatory protein RecX [Oscillospiraceae bacterium]
MPRIDRVEPSKHVKGRYLVFLDTGAMLKVGQGELLDFGLRPGLVLEGNDFDRLLSSSLDTQAKARAARMIGARPLSKTELVSRLVKKGEGEAQAQKAADWLEELGAVNDAEYARTIVRHYDHMGYGPQKIREELYRRKVPREYWEEAMEEMRPGLEAAEAFLAGKLRYREVTEKELQRQMNALRRRGFGWDVIREAIRPYERQLNSCCDD